MHLASLRFLGAGLFAAATLHSTAAAQVCSTTLDLNTAPTSTPTEIDQGRFPSLEYPGSDVIERGYAPFVELGGNHYFAGTTAALGTELYRTDGTALGTYLVADTTPGAASTGPCMLTSYLGDLFFVDSDNPTRQLYRMSSATGAVTSLGVVGDADYDFGDARMVVVGGKLLFIGKDAAEGYELWSSDGTAAGTGPLKALSPGTGSSQIRHLLANDSGTFAVFLVEQAGGARSVWTTDGTSAGTQQVATTVSIATPIDTVPAWTARFGNDLLFIQVDAQGAHLVRTDGVSVQTLATPGGSISLARTALYNGELHFSAGSVAAGVEVWKTDGTPAGTQLVVDVRSGAPPSNPTHFAVANGKLFFIAETNALGRELLAWDGANLVTLDIQPGAEPAFYLYSDVVQEVAATSAGVFFRPSLLGAPSRLYFSDGTLAGTGMVGAADPQAHSFPHSMTPLANGELLFAATAASGEAGIRLSDGLTITLVEALAGSPGTLTSNAELLRVVAPDVVLLRAKLGPSGGFDSSLLRMSPFGGVEELVKGLDFPIVSLPQSASAPSGDGDLLFVGSPQPGEVHMYVSEEVPGVVHQLPDLVPNPIVYIPYWVARTDQGLIVATLGAESGFASFASGLWAVSADNSTLTPLGDMKTDPPAQLDGKVVYGAPFGGQGVSIKVTDGTPAGTMTLLDWAPPAAGGVFVRFGKAAERATFFLERFGLSVDIGVTDGTVAGTQVAALGGLVVDDFVEPAGFGDEVYFVADDGVLGRELYAFDVANGQVRLVADVLAGAAESAPQRLTEVADGIVFTARSVAGDLEFFHTDGQVTVQISNLGATTPVHAVGELLVAPEAVYAAVGLDAGIGGGIGLVAIDAGMTTLICDDLLPGGTPPKLIAYDGGLLFAGNDPLLGSELMHVPLNVARAEAFGQGATLSATAPQLGGTSVVRSTAGPAPLVSALAFSSPATWPLEVPGLASEALWLDPSGYQILGFFAGGNWAYPAAVPSSPALLGAHANLQALYLGAAFPGTLSNPVALTLGF